MSDVLTKRQGRYTAELSMGDERIQVDIEDTAGNYGSLALAMDGYLTSKNGDNEVPVVQKDIDLIVAWAIKHGY